MSEAKPLTDEALEALNKGFCGCACHNQVKRCDHCVVAMSADPKVRPVERQRFVCPGWNGQRCDAEIEAVYQGDPKIDGGWAFLGCAVHDHFTNDDVPEYHTLIGRLLERQATTSLRGLEGRLRDYIEGWRALGGTVEGDKGDLKVAVGFMYRWAANELEALLVEEGESKCTECGNKGWKYAPYIGGDDDEEKVPCPRGCKEALLVEEGER